MVINARFIHPPQSIIQLQSLTGLDSEVGTYIEEDPDFDNFFKNLTEMILIFLRRYKMRYSDPIIIAIGCTGGQHRSVYTAEKLVKVLMTQGYLINIEHRELKRYGNLKSPQSASGVA